MATTTTTTALDLFSEQEVIQYEQLSGDVETIKRGLDSLQLRTQDDAIKAHDLLTDVKRTYDHIEMVRTAQVGPLNDQVNAYNATWKPRKDALKLIEADLKRKILAFNNAERERVARAQAEARRQQEEAARKQQEALAKAAAAKSSAARSKALAKAEEQGQAIVAAQIAMPMDAPTGIRTELGTTAPTWRWVFTVADAAQVPRQYLIVDEKAIRRAVAEGVRDIPGVSIYQEETLATRIS